MSFRIPETRCFDGSCSKNVWNCYFTGHVSWANRVVTKSRFQFLVALHISPTPRIWRMLGVQGYFHVCFWPVVLVRAAGSSLLYLFVFSNTGYNTCCLKQIWKYFKEGHKQLTNFPDETDVWWELAWPLGFAPPPILAWSVLPRMGTVCCIWSCFPFPGNSCSF